eukprot:5348699-Pyramimonas_sp.AAC.1
MAKEFGVNVHPGPPQRKLQRLPHLSDPCRVSSGPITARHTAPVAAKSAQGSMASGHVSNIRARIHMLAPIIHV